MNCVLSVIIPTRERAAYLPFCIRTCTRNSTQQLEILVLDNASTDGTAQAVASIDDPRVRYERSDARLSMRDNFERGLQLAKGDVLCFLGDDDGLLPGAADEALELLSNPRVEALSAARAHYRWPDLQAVGRNTAFLPRRSGTTILNSRAEMRSLLRDCDYYRVPCLYHNFVRRSLVEKVLGKQGRFFLSSQVDIYSAIALSMENVDYLFSERPLVINGGSKRSNGGSHFGYGGALEKTLWKKEDDLGFLPGFEDSLTIEALIIESALRYAAAHGFHLSDMLDERDVRAALELECKLRREAGRPDERRVMMFNTAGLSEAQRGGSSERRLSDLHLIQQMRKFVRLCPIRTEDKGITNVYECALYLRELQDQQRLGFSDRPLEQISIALRAVRG